MIMFSREWAVMMRHGTDMSHQLTHVRRLDVDENGNRKEMSATAIGFLVPLFVLFLIGPFCCVFCVRKRRRRPNPRATPVTQTPTTSERREDARKKLEDVTQISKVTGYQKYAYMGDTKQEAAVDASSILERECIICLSTLYPPCAPEPVQTAFHPRSKETGTPSAVGDGMPVTKAPSVSETSFAEKEQILKLKICGHEFHAECLMSWFMIHKYSCPMCRAVYFQLGEDEHAENAGGENRSSATRYGREDV